MFVDTGHYFITTVQPIVHSGWSARSFCSKYLQDRQKEMSLTVYIECLAVKTDIVTTVYVEIKRNVLDLVTNTWRQDR